MSQSTSHRTDGLVAFVTGGSRGIGAEVVSQLLEHGYAVAYTHTGEHAEVARHNTDALAIRADVADVAQTTAAFRRAETELGPVTSLVNNAGVTGRLGPYARLPLDELRRVLEVNVWGTMTVTQHVVQRWLASSPAIRGSIVNVSSVAAALGAPGEYVHYAGAKAAIEAFTVGLAKELAPAGIRVNAVQPGTVQTGIHAAAGDPDRPRRVAERIPLGRVGEPDEIAKVIVWLLARAPEFVTGAVVKASGGL